MPREKESAENIWEGSWLPDRLWKDSIGVQEPARLLWITHTTLPKALLPHCRVLPNSLHALQSDGSMALPCALQPGISGSGVLALPLLFQTASDQDWKRHSQADFSMCSLHLWL